MSRSTFSGYWSVAKIGRNLEVAVDDLAIVEVLDCENHLSEVELRNVFWKTNAVVELVEELAAGTEVEYQEQVVPLS